MSNLKEFQAELKAMCGNDQVTRLTEEGQVTYSKICNVTDELYQVTITAEQYLRISLHNLKVQDECPELDANQREFIINGTTPTEWEEMFKDQEEWEEHNAEELNQTEEALEGKVSSANDEQDLFDDNNASMNIYALQGSKVKVTLGTLTNGYDADQERVRALLHVEKEYTVKHTQVCSSVTNVFLEEIEGYAFNSVMFISTSPQSVEDNKKHKDWSKYN